MDRGLIDPKAPGSIRIELNATAVIDGQRGLAPLIFMRAARIAQEKAREAGAGVVRVTNVGGVGPVAAIVTDIAIGPNIAVCYGPGPSWTVAVPTMGGMPAVFSTELGGNSAEPPAWSILGFPAWSFPLAEEGSWLFAAYSVKAFESLEAFHERVGAQLVSRPKVRGEVRPADWQARREGHLANGVVLGAEAEQDLKSRAERSNLDWPDPIADGSGSCGHERTRLRC